MAEPATAELGSFHDFEAIYHRQHGLRPDHSKPVQVEEHRGLPP